MNQSLFHRSSSWWRHSIVIAAFCGLLFACTARQPQPPPAPQTGQTPAPRSGQVRPYRVAGIWYHPLEHARDYVEEGRASWYGEDFHGRRTSSGEIYDMYALTAAHKTLPLGTYVRVHNLNNGRSVDVRINDRGPFVRSRIIDLSFSAADAIDMIGPGTAPVKIIALGAPDPRQSATSPAYLPIDYYSGNFSFQVGAFTEKANAQRLVDKLIQQYSNAHIATYFDGSRTFYRVRVGKAGSLEEAEQLEKRLAQEGYPETFIIAE